MGADASPEAGRKVAGRLAGRTEGEAGRNEACRVVSCRARQPAPQVAVSGVWTRPKRRAGTRTRTRTRIQQKMYYWQEQSEADARAPDTMGAPVPPTQQPVAGRAQSGWSLPCRLPAESKRSAPARLPAPARGCPALPLVPALLLASECSRRLRGRHATLIITTPLSGGRPATARHPAPATWFCWPSLALRSRQWQGHATASWVGIGAPVHPDRKPRMAATAIMGRRTASAFV